MIVLIERLLYTSDNINPHSMCLSLCQALHTNTHTISLTLRVCLSLYHCLFIFLTNFKSLPKVMWSFPTREQCR